MANSELNRGEVLFTGDDRVAFDIEASFFRLIYVIEYAGYFRLCELRLFPNWAWTGEDGDNNYCEHYSQN